MTFFYIYFPMHTTILNPPPTNINLFLCSLLLWPTVHAEISFSVPLDFIKLFLDAFSSSFLDYFFMLLKYILIILSLEKVY